MIASKRQSRRKMAAFKREQAQLSGIYGDGYTWPRGQHWPKSFSSKRGRQYRLARFAAFTMPINVTMADGQKVYAVFALP